MSITILRKIPSQKIARPYRVVDDERELNELIHHQLHLMSEDQDIPMNQLLTTMKKNLDTDEPILKGHLGVEYFAFYDPSGWEKE